MRWIEDGQTSALRIGKLDGLARSICFTSWRPATLLHHSQNKPQYIGERLSRAHNDGGRRPATVLFRQRPDIVSGGRPLVCRCLVFAIWSFISFSFGYLEPSASTFSISLGEQQCGKHRLHMSRSKHSKKRSWLGDPIALQAEANWRAVESARRVEEYYDEKLKLQIKLNQLEVQEAKAYRVYRSSVDYTDDEQCSKHSATWRNRSNGKTPSLDPSTYRLEESSDRS